MRKTIFIIANLVFIFIMSCKSQNTTNETKLKRDDLKKSNLVIDTVAESEIKSAYDFAYQTFMNCDTYEFPKLTSENATERLVKLWDTEKQKVVETCDKYNSTYGKLIKLNLSEILSDKTGYKYFRYKATFSETKNIAEIRVYTNSDNKFDGIIIKPKWSNEYSEWNEKTKSE